MGLLLAAGLAVVLGLQLVRVFLPLATFYLYDARGLSPAVTAAISLGVFLLALPAPALARRLGWGRALRWAAAGLALLRLAEQATPSPAADVWLAAAGTALFSLVLALLLLGAARAPAMRAELAYSVLLALALETAIRALAGTLDLSWRSGWPAGLVVLVLAGAALVAAGAGGSGKTTPIALASRPWDWLALGSWVALYLLVYSNPASLAARAGMPLERASWFLLGGWLAGLVAAATATGLGPSLLRTLQAAALAGAGTWMAFFAGDDAWFGVLIGAPGMALLLFDLLATAPRGITRGRAAGVAGVVLLAILYLVYGRYDQPFGPSDESLLLAALVGLIAPCLLIAWRSRSERWPAAWGPWTAAAVAALAVAGLGARLLAAPAPPPAAGPGPLRVLTYNLHQGFGTSGHLDPEALAREIEAESPDVVALQEVARGWLVTGGLDLQTWLERRLGMRGVFAGTADPQWGNAVLSRLPILESANHPLPTEELPLRRGALDVTLDTDDGPLRILCIHFHHRRGDDAIREAQTRALLRIWDGSPATLLVGDFNALPGSAAIGALQEAGLHDASVLLPAGERFTITRAGNRQIDWIFATPDLAFAETRVRFTRASDHLPLATTVRPAAAPAAGAAAPRRPPG